MSQTTINIEDRQPTMGERLAADREHEVLTIAELAGALRCSKAHACKILNGQVKGLPALPHLALGRRKLIRRTSLAAWMARVEVGNTASAVVSSARQDSMSQAHGKEGNHHA